jgi:hypothetical protein
MRVQQIGPHRPGDRMQALLESAHQGDFRHSGELAS